MDIHHSMLPNKNKKYSVKDLRHIAEYFFSECQEIKPDINRKKTDKIVNKIVSETIYEPKSK